MSNLRFADDIVLISDSVDDMLKMLEDLRKESSRIGLKMNVGKTKIMTNIPDSRRCDMPVEVVDDYVYLGHKISLGYKNQTAEIDRIIAQAWSAFGANKAILRSKKIPQHLKTRVFDQCVLPVFTYGMETATLTQKSAEKLRVAQRAMERAMLGISLREQKRNEWIRKKTRIRDVVVAIEQQKWRWAGHIARMEQFKWTRRLMEWRPWENRRGRGRPPMRWVDDISKIAGPNWMKVARSRQKWKDLEEAYVRRRTT